MTRSGASLDVRGILAGANTWSEANESVSSTSIINRACRQLLEGIGSTRTFHPHILHSWERDQRTNDRCFQHLAERPRRQVEGHYKGCQYATYSKLTVSLLLGCLLYFSVTQG